jgi:ADP-ribose pyrophosphatase YjhB (NUDIX family)
MKEGEDPEKACMRELLEETGLRGNLGDLIGSSIFLSRRRSLRMTNVQLNFIVYVTEYDVALDPATHSAYKWLPWEEAENDLLDSFTQDIIKSALRYLPANERSVGRSAGLLGGQG